MLTNLVELGKVRRHKIVVDVPYRESERARQSERDRESVSEGTRNVFRNT